MFPRTPLPCSLLQATAGFAPVFPGPGQEALGLLPLGTVSEEAGSLPVIPPAVHCSSTLKGKTML